MCVYLQCNDGKFYPSLLFFKINLRQRYKVNNCSESYQLGIKVKCELEESAYASEVHSVQSAFDSIYYDDEFISFSNWLVRVNKAKPTAPGQAVHVKYVKLKLLSSSQCTKQ